MNLDELAEVGRLQDASLDGYVDAARRRLDAPPPVRRRWRPLLAVAAIAGAAIAAFVLRSSGGAEPITFEVGARPGEPLEPIEAPHDAELAVRFSDHTTVMLAADTRGVVDEVTSRGARLRVHRGRASVSVPPRQNAEWTFSVGPFEVAVTGTRFDVGWDDAAKTFELVMHDGAVRVTGPTLDGGRVVVAGETLRIPLGAPPEPSVDAAVDAAPDAPPVVLAPPTPVPVHRVESADAAVPDARVATWQELAAGGDFKGALAQVHDHFDDVLASASAPELTTLGDAARYTGDLSRAQQAYLAVRRRFPADAATATFALARMAFQAPDDALAVRYLDLYLRENPDGAFAREALGRLLEVEIRTRDDAGARRTAARYLELYPAGPHAKLARSVMP
jgi:hypothetical protein